MRLPMAPEGGVCSQGANAYAQRGGRWNDGPLFVRTPLLQDGALFHVDAEKQEIHEEQQAQDFDDEEQDQLNPFPQRGLFRRRRRWSCLPRLRGLLRLAHSLFRQAPVDRAAGVPPNLPR